MGAVGGGSDDEVAVHAARAAEAARVLAESLQGTDRLAAVIVELERQLQTRAEDMAKLRGDFEHAAVLANYVQDECMTLRAKLLLAEAEVVRLNDELRVWRS
jgi:precorrin-2 methylase